MRRRDFIRAAIGLVGITTLPRSLFGRIVSQTGHDPSPGTVRAQRADDRPLVVEVHRPDAVGRSAGEYYIDQIDPQIVSEMLRDGLFELTGTSNLKAAWGAILGGVGRDDRVAIKPNFNGVEKHYREVVTSPQLLNAVLFGLVEAAGLPPKNIYIYDLSRVIPDYLRDRIVYDVNFVQGYPTTFLGKVRKKLGLDKLNEPDPDSPVEMSEEIVDRRGRPVACYLPRILERVDHLINMPILKGHIFVITSCALKNHYGTVRFDNGATSPRFLHPPRLTRAVVDINSQRQIREKTRIVVCDALMASYDAQPGTGPLAWRTFGDGNPSSLLLGTDPVAVDSVAAHYVTVERAARQLEIRSNDYLALAEKAGLGVFEAPEEDRGFKKIELRNLA